MRNIPQKKETSVAISTTGSQSETHDELQGVHEFSRLVEIAHKGFIGTMEAIGALYEIKDKKLYLRQLDEQGKPRYTTFENFLQYEFGLSRSNFCRMQNAYIANKRLNEKYGECHPYLVKAIAEHVDPYYELSKISGDKLDEAISDFAEESSKGDIITASRIRQWRKDHQSEHHRIKPTITVPHEVVEQTMNDVDTVSLESPNAAEATQSEARSGEGVASSATTITGAFPPLDLPDITSSSDSHNATAETEAQDGIELNDTDDEDDDYIVEQIRKIAALLNTERFIEYFAKDDENYQWLTRIVREVGSNVVDYRGYNNQEN